MINKKHYTLTALTLLLSFSIEKAKAAKVEAEKDAANEAATANAIAKKAIATAEQAAKEADTKADEAKKAKAAVEKALANATKAEAEYEKALANARKAIDVAKKAVAEKAVAETEKALVNAEKARAETKKALVNAEKAKAVVEKAVAETKKALVNAEKAEADHKKALANTSKAIDVAKKAGAEAKDKQEALVARNAFIKKLELYKVTTPINLHEAIITELKNTQDNIAINNLSPSLVVQYNDILDKALTPQKEMVDLLISKYSRDTIEKASKKEMQKVWEYFWASIRPMHIKENVGVGIYPPSYDFENKKLSDIAYILYEKFPKKETSFLNNQKNSRNEKALNDK